MTKVVCADATLQDAFIGGGYMSPEAVVRTITTLMSNLQFDHYEPDSTPTCLVLRRSDDKMKVWVEQDGMVWIGKTREEAVQMSDVLGDRTML